MCAVKLSEYLLLVGQHTEVFQKQKRPELADLSLSLVQRIDMSTINQSELDSLNSSTKPNTKEGKMARLVPAKRTLDVVCKDKEEFFLWKKGLTYLTNGPPPIEYLISRMKAGAYSNYLDSGIGGGSRGILVQNFEPFSGSGIAAPLQRTVADVTTTGFGKELTNKFADVHIVDLALADNHEDLDEAVLTNKEQAIVRHSYTPEELRELANDPEKSRNAAVTPEPSEDIEAFLQRRIIRAYGSLGIFYN